MSEEEIIKEVKGYLDFEEGISMRAIQGLLDLYNEEKEKNKELENTDLTTVYMNGFYDGEKKWKDKIKTEIEKFDCSGTHVYIGTRSYGKSTRAVIALVLSELLEERN